jgi:uncharacterized membrane protein YkoI
MKTVTNFAVVLAAVAAMPLVCLGQQRRESKEISLRNVVIALEKDYDAIAEISWDDGAWEVEAVKGDMAFELAIDPRSGERLYEYRDYGEVRPPSDSLKLSKIVGVLEKAGYVQIDEVSFERRSWEVEAVRDNQKREIHLDPATGEIISDRIDD